MKFIVIALHDISSKVIYTTILSWCLIVTAQVGAEKFEKEYAYGIRHNYGREGKRTVSASPFTWN